MRPNHVRTRWEAEECVLNCWLSGSTSVQAQLIGAQGFDSVVVDLQHGAFGRDDVTALLGALARTSATPIVRVPNNDAASIMQVLDAGAYGVICPAVNSRAEAEAFVAACRYPPQGSRSFGPSVAAVHAQTDPQSYFLTANDTVLTIALIETAEAMANLEEIVATAGLDAVYVGSADLSVSFGGMPVMDLQEGASMRRHLRIIDAAHSAGIKVGLHAGTIDDVKLCIDHKADLVTVTTDLSALTQRTAHALDVSRRILAEARGARVS